MASSPPPIMHGRLMDQLTSRFYPDLVTIQQYTGPQNSIGEEVKTWGAVAGLSDLPCAIGESGGSEPRRPDGIVAVSPWRIAIAGYYPTIVPKMRAVVDGGSTYNILVVQVDSHHNMTALDCEIVT